MGWLGLGLGLLIYDERLATCSKCNINASHMSENIVKQMLSILFSHTDVDILI